MSSNSGRLPKKFIIYILIAISILLIAIPENITNHIKITAASPLAPVQKVFFQTVNFCKNGFKKMASVMECADEKEELREKVFYLQNKIVKQQNIINTLIKKLEAVSEFRKNIDDKEKALVADIIGHDTSNFRRSIIINVGKKQGVSVDDVVVFGSALAGRVSAVGNSLSRVKLITDPSSNVPSRLLKSRVQGIVQGKAQKTCVMKYVPRQETVKEGDNVVSSGIEGIFPKSVYIGHIIEVEESGTKLFKDIKLEPRIDFSKIEHVSVIRKILNHQ